MTQFSTRLVWGVYLALLAVLLPHTAWAFGQFEPAGWTWLGWVAAFAFEAAIAALTWRLKERIEATPKYRAGLIWLRRLHFRYLNVYGLGLIVAIGVSGAANWAHAVEFGRSFAVFARYSVPPVAYSVAFGAILPACSLIFARVLADVQETEHEIDDEFAQLRRERRQAERRITELSARLNEAEDVLRIVAGGDKRQRILAIKAQWPALPNSAVAIMAESSPSYVSEVLRALPAIEEQEV